MPPQSLIQARRSSRSDLGERFGGACRFARAPSTSRAVATVRAISASLASGASAMPVSGLARKFWTIVSWT